MKKANKILSLAAFAALPLAAGIVTPIMMTNVQNDSNVVSVQEETTELIDWTQYSEYGVATANFEYESEDALYTSATFVVLTNTERAPEGFSWKVFVTDEEAENATPKTADVDVVINGDTTTLTTAVTKTVLDLDEYPELELPDEYPEDGIPTHTYLSNGTTEAEEANGWFVFDGTGVNELAEYEIIQGETTDEEGNTIDNILSSQELIYFLMAAEIPAPPASMPWGAAWGIIAGLIGVLVLAPTGMYFWINRKNK